MPPLADPSVLPITVSSNMQQFSSSSGRVSELTVYGITGISPSCASQEGIAVLTVRGRYLIDELDLTRNQNRFYCRFGTVTETGATKPDGVSPGEPQFFQFAFHFLPCCCMLRMSSKNIAPKRPPGCHQRTSCMYCPLRQNLKISEKTKFQ